MGNDAVPYAGCRAGLLPARAVRRHTSPSQWGPLPPLRRSGGDPAARLALYEVGPASLAARVPAAGDGLLTGEEVDGVTAVSVQVAQEGVLPSREREECDRRGDPDVDADHSGLHVVAVA